MKQGKSRIGRYFRKKANGFRRSKLSEKSQEFGQEEIWSGLETALQALYKTVVAFPPLQSAIGTLITCLDVLEEATQNRQSFREFARKLKSLCDTLIKHLKQAGSARMSGSMANISRSIGEQAELIEECRGKADRIMEKRQFKELSGHSHRIESLFGQLEADLDWSTWHMVDDQKANAQLELLNPALLAHHDPALSEGIFRRTCTANTRTKILSTLDTGSRDSKAAGLFWMTGMPGTGKTTIACSFAKLLENHNRLAASFFCTRNIPECREVTRIIPTIAYQLARYSLPFRSALCEILDENPDAGGGIMKKQFDLLLRRPLLKVKKAIPNNLVVVIDGLDECSDMRLVELLLSILLKSVAQIPLRFFVTSRQEPDIYKRILARGLGASDVLILHDIDKSLVQSDIELYLAEELQLVSPTPDQVKELARRCNNLFIYAATVVRYIHFDRESTGLSRRLQFILSMDGQPVTVQAGLDELYTAIFDAALPPSYFLGTEIEDARLVLRTAVCAREPVDIDTLAALAGLDAYRIRGALKALCPVIHVSADSGLITILHASFSDFLFDKARSKSFSCDLAETSDLLARRCFEILKEQLKFNICNLESSFVPDHQIENLENHIRQNISPSLCYASRYWSDHLRQSPYSDSLCRILSEFLSARLLFWMEVLNLNRENDLGADALLKAKSWLKVGPASPSASMLIWDAWTFLRSFAGNPVSQCTPHIYLSSLPFCPKSSTVFQNYWKNTKGLLKVTGSAMERREAVSPARWMTNSEVLSVVYSPDGSRFAFACVDGTIQTKSAHDGSFAAAFQGHTSSVSSLAYSPDSAYIVSGSYDTTLRVWNSQDGTFASGPFEGHKSIVHSVAYSPDGTQIASGSGDKTIRVWNARNGELAADPFEGHKGMVFSVAYSPDGTCIVSGSSDKTIRVWDRFSGTILAGPFKGHGDSILSVAYSPDGKHIVSGSCDMTIRVWNAHNGKLAMNPFRGHRNSVLSVAYSSGGRHIVSSSSDRTVFIWDARNGQRVGDGGGHSDLVSSVAYSPDGTSIVSGSFDQTIRVWNASALEYPPIDDHATSRCRLELGATANHPDFSKTYHIPSPDIALRNCTVRQDGWLVNDYSRLLFWVPFELVNGDDLGKSRYAHISSGSFSIDFGNLFYGPRWDMCYNHV